MSYLSAQAKTDIETEGKEIKLGHRSKNVHRDYTDFAGSNVLPLTREQYKKAMKGYLEIEIIHETDFRNRR